MAFVSPLPLQAHRPTTATARPRKTCPMSADAPLPRARTPRRVGIAGAGIAGLSTALALLKTQGTGVEEVTLFEPRTTLDTELGAALNLNAAGVILTKCYGLGPQLLELGNPLERVRCVAADGTPAGGRVLMEVDVERAVRSDAALRDAALHDGRVPLVTMMRDTFQGVLASALPPGAEVVRGKRVARVVPAGDVYHFEFDDGAASGPFDMVIGADGIRSAVREHLHGGEAPPRYSGIQVQFAVTPPRPRSPSSDTTLRQYMGDGAYALRYSGGVSRTHVQDVVALSYASRDATPENGGYAACAARDALAARLAASGIAQDGVADACGRAARHIGVGVHYHAPVGRWSDARGGCVLVGDAAHAMPPFLGAGAGQAVQDAHALARALARRGGVRAAVSAFEAERVGPSAAVMRASRAIGLLDTQRGAGAVVRDAVLWGLGSAGVAEKVFLKSALPRV